MFLGFCGQSNLVFLATLQRLFLKRPTPGCFSLAMILGEFSVGIYPFLNAKLFTKNLFVQDAERSHKRNCGKDLQCVKRRLRRHRLKTILTIKDCQLKSSIAIISILFQEMLSALGVNTDFEVMVDHCLERIAKQCNQFLLKTDNK